MRREDAKRYLREQLPTYLNLLGLSAKKPMRCLNPAHSDRTPSMSYDPNQHRVHCFSCEASYDIFDLVALNEGIDDPQGKGFYEVLNRAAAIMGVSIDSADTSHQSSGSARPSSAYDIVTEQHRRALDARERLQFPSPRYDFSSVVDSAAAALKNMPDAMAHFTARGLSPGTVERFKLGYTPGMNELLQAFPELQTKSYKQNRYNYVIPCLSADGTCSYFALEIADRSECDQYNAKYRKPSTPKPENIPQGEEWQLPAILFNEWYITGNDTSGIVFVTEGYYDALAFEELGYKAIALGGTASKRFISLCERYKPDIFFVDALDRDDAGRKAANDIAGQMESIGGRFRVTSDLLLGESKDAGEAIVVDRAGLSARVSECVHLLQEEIEKDDLPACAADYVDSFLDDIKGIAGTPCISTGFYMLDEQLDGGLYEGLYVVGAISSLGKTTFLLQIADQLAARGQDVILFSLEMSRSEIISKSISRITRQLCSDTRDAKTNRGITDYSRWEKYSEREKGLIAAAVERYRQAAEHIFIIEGNGDIGFEEVRKEVERLVRKGRNPVVIIDYLQILKPFDFRASDKQNVDKAVFELKRLSRDYKLTVIGISSFNRDNYSAAVSMQAFKESGAIEYSSDVLIGLQLHGQDIKDFDIKEAKRMDPREVEVHILKNRNGAADGVAYFHYHKMFNFYEEAAPGSMTPPPIKAKARNSSSDAPTDNRGSSTNPYASGKGKGKSKKQGEVTELIIDGFTQIPGDIEDTPFF